MLQLETIWDLRRVLKQPPNDLKVVISRNNKFYSINKIKDVYCIQKRDNKGNVFYEQVNEKDKNAIQMVAIL